MSTTSDQQNLDNQKSQGVDFYTLFHPLQGVVNPIALEAHQNIYDQRGQCQVEQPQLMYPGLITQTRECTTNLASNSKPRDGIAFRLRISTQAKKVISKNKNFDFQLRKDKARFQPFEQLFVDYMYRIPKGTYCMRELLGYAKQHPKYPQDGPKSVSWIGKLMRQHKFEHLRINGFYDAVDFEQVKSFAPWPTQEQWQALWAFGKQQNYQSVGCQDDEWWHYRGYNNVYAPIGMDTLTKIKDQLIQQYPEEELSQEPSMPFNQKSQKVKLPKKHKSGDQKQKEKKIEKKYIDKSKQTRTPRLQSKNKYSPYGFLNHTAPFIAKGTAKEVTYHSMPDFKVEACAMLAMMWAHYGTQNFVDELYPYNLCEDKHQQVKPVYTAMDEFKKSPKMQGLLKSGHILITQDKPYTIRGRIDMQNRVYLGYCMISITHIGYGEAAPFIIQDSEDGSMCHVWVQDYLVQAYNKCYNDQYIDNLVSNSPKSTIDVQQDSTDELTSKAIASEQSSITSVSQPKTVKSDNCKTKKDKKVLKMTEPKIIKEIKPETQLPPKMSVTPKIINQQSVILQQPLNIMDHTKKIYGKLEYESRESWEHFETMKWVNIQLYQKMTVLRTAMDLYSYHDWWRQRPYKSVILSTDKGTRSWIGPEADHKPFDPNTIYQFTRDFFRSVQIYHTSIHRYAYNIQPITQLPHANTTKIKDGKYSIPDTRARCGPGDFQPSPYDNWMNDFDFTGCHIVFNGVQKKRAQYHCFGQAYIRMATHDEQCALIKPNGQVTILTCEFDMDWQDIYPGNIFTVRIGFNALLCVPGEVLLNLAPLKLNYRPLYHAGIQQNITADTYIVDLIRSDHQLTVYTNTQSYQARINRAIQTHGNSVVNQRSVILNDITSELNESFTRAVVYLNAELVSHPGFGNDEITGVGWFPGFVDNRNKHDTTFQIKWSFIDVILHWIRYPHRHLNRYTIGFLLLYGAAWGWLIGVLFFGVSSDIRVVYSQVAKYLGTQFKLDCKLLLNTCSAKTMDGFKIIKYWTNNLYHRVHDLTLPKPHPVVYELEYDWWRNPVKYLIYNHNWAFKAPNWNNPMVQHELYQSVGSHVVSTRTHIDKTRFREILVFNPKVLDRYKFQNNTFKFTGDSAHPGRVLTQIQVDEIYDHLEQFCSCHKNPPKVNCLNIVDLNDNELADCFTDCAINAIFAIFRRQCAADLDATDMHKVLYAEFTKQNPDVVDLIASINQSQDRPSVKSYLDKISKEQPSKLKLYISKARILCKQNDLNYQCTNKAKDGEYVLKMQQDYSTKEPRSIYSAPEATVIYGGAVSQIVTKHMMNNPHIGICRKTEWIEKRVKQMHEQFQNPQFVTMDGKRFDSTQHWWMRQCVDNYVYDATSLYDKLDIRREHQVQAYNINCGEFAHYQTFLGKKMDRHCFFTCVIRGTMSSGKNDTSTMNSLRQTNNIAYTVNYIKQRRNPQFRADWVVAGDDLLICFDKAYVEQWEWAVRELYSDVLIGVHGIGQCVTEITYHQPNQFSFLSKIGYVDSLNCYFMRQPKRIFDLQVKTDALDQDMLSLQNCLWHSLAHSLPNEPLIVAMQQYLYHTKKSSLTLIDKHLSAYRRHEIEMQINTVDLPPWLYQIMIQQLGDTVDDREYYIERMESLKGFKRLTDQTHIPQPNKIRYLFSECGRLVNGLNYWKPVASWLITSRNVSLITKNQQSSEKQFISTASTLVTDAHSICGMQTTQISYLIPEFVQQDIQITEPQDGIIYPQLLDEYQAVGMPPKKAPQKQNDVLSTIKEIVRENKNSYLKSHPGATHQSLIKHLKSFMGDRELQAFEASKVKLPTNNKGSKPKAKKVIKPQIQGKQTVLKAGTYVRVGLQEQYQAVGMMSKKQTSQFKQNKTGWRKPLSNPFVQSICKPFKTEIIKPAYDYPLNTSTVEQTLEVDVVAQLGNGNGKIPNATYGVVVAILPHSYQDLVITDGSGTPQSSGINGTLSNMRLITVMKQGTGASTDTLINVPSPLNTFWGTNNSIGKRWCSARLIRLGIRLIPTSPLLSRGGIIAMVQIPGKDVPLTFSVGNLGQSGAILPVPTIQQMRNYPTSFEATTASNADEFGYVWFPTDAIDQVFMQDYLALASNTLDQNRAITGDFDTFSNHTRNAIYIVGNNLASTDTFRLEVKVSYEFVPTTEFRIWSEDEGPRASNNDVSTLRELTINIPTLQADQESTSIFSQLGGLALGMAKSALSSNIVADMAFEGFKHVMKNKF